jgi:hypothetical protein
VAQLIAQAEAAQEQMLVAPEMLMGDMNKSKHDALIEVHCPECLGETSKDVAVFGDASKRLDGYAASGYKPVLDEKGNIVRDEGGNPLLTTKRKLFDAKQKVFQDESNARLRDLTKLAKKKNGLLGEEQAVGTGVFDEELSIKRSKGG